MDYNDFLLILIFVAIIGLTMFAFAAGIMIRTDLKIQSKLKAKKKTEAAKPEITSNPTDPCPLQREGFYFGFLKKELSKSTPIPESCLANCSLKLECLEGKKPK